jgi:hypothetical protein
MPLGLIAFFVPTTAVILFGIACWLWRPDGKKRGRKSMKHPSTRNTLMTSNLPKLCIKKRTSARL